MTAADERLPAALRRLHWLMAILLLVQVLSGWMAERLVHRALAMVLMQGHAQLGALLLGMLFLRVLVRWRQGVPALTPPDPPWRRRAAGAVHTGLYTLLLLLPLSGAVMWVWHHYPLALLGLVHLPPLFDARPVDETPLALAWYLHAYGAWVLTALLGLHIGAALWHQCVRRDRRITRRFGSMRP
jgi:cytochrome b561